MRISRWVPEKLKSLCFFNREVPVWHAERLGYFSTGQQTVLIALALLAFGSLYARFYFLPSFDEVRSKEVTIEVLGDVERPGFHLFQSPPTLWEAIEKAGGTKDLSLSNRETLSQTLEPGTSITFQRFSPGEIKILLGRMESKKLLLFSLPLDLNKVSVDDLCLVPGISESLAQEMVRYRQRRGGFRSVEELKEVKGIGEYKLKALSSYFEIRPSR